MFVFVLSTRSIVDIVIAIVFLITTNTIILIIVTRSLMLIAITMMIMMRVRMRVMFDCRHYV